MKPIAAPKVGGMITFTIHVLILILVPVFFVLMEGTVSPAWYVTAGACGVMEVRKPMLGNFVKN
jgi:hypothetical protein